MSTHSDGGKGSERRPGAGYQDGWDRIFGRKPKTCPPCHGDCEQGRSCPARAGNKKAPETGATDGDEAAQASAHALVLKSPEAILGMLVQAVNTHMQTWGYSPPLHGGVNNAPVCLLKHARACTSIA